MNESVHTFEALEYLDIGEVVVAENIDTTIAIMNNGTGSRSSDEVDAYGALFAAAPAMLAALKECAHEIATICNRRLTSGEQSALDNAREVIAKAEGNS